MWVIDIESSGLHPSSYPIEIGLTNGDYEYQALVRPMAHWTYWSDEYELAHNISRCRLFREGEEPADVALSLNEILQGETVYADVVTWNDFWVKVLFFDCGMQQSFQLQGFDAPASRGRWSAPPLTGSEQPRYGEPFQVIGALDGARIIWQHLKCTRMPLQQNL